MFKVNRKIEYSLMALKHMSKMAKGEKTTVKELCACYKIPFDLTSRVMQKMAYSTLLKSEKGLHGGYQLQKDLSRLSFLKLIEIILGPFTIAHCLDKEHETCNIFSTCNMILPIKKLNGKVRTLFQTITVQELLETTKPQKLPTPIKNESTPL